MSYFKRLLAKFFDYTLLYSVLYLIGSKLDIVRNNVLITALVLIVPILWILFETLFLKIFGTTLGKALLGIRLKEKLSLKKIFTHSLCSLCPLFTFKKIESDFVYKNCGISRLIVSALMITAFTSSSIIWDQMHPRSTATFSMHTEEYTDWTPHSGDLFTIYFPAKPESTTDTLVLPEDYDDLPLTEHKASLNSIDYSIAYTTMPKAWLKYSNSMIIKYSVKYMAREMEDTTIVSRAYAQHGPHQAVDYVLNSKGKQITGRMLLIKDRMYKIEVTHEPSADISHQAELFFQSFIPS